MNRRNTTMTAFGKSIRLYLMDGTPNGRWMCELSNWRGKAYKLPRTMLKECEKRSDLRSSGVYFLFGTDDDSGKPLVYIGETEDIITRLYQHLDSKDYWTEAIVFVTTDDHLNKAHIKHLENRFYTIATEAKRYIVKNGNIPKKSAISEAEQAELEEFIFNAELLMTTLGHRVFEPFIDTDKTASSESLLHFTRNKGSGGKAEGKLTSEGFVVMMGSYIHPKIADYVSPGIKDAREKYASIINANGILQEDVLFSSPSFASTFVCGKNSNGLTEWKDDNGVSLKELEAKVTEVAD